MQLRTSCLVVCLILAVVSEPVGCSSPLGSWQGILGNDPTSISITASRVSLFANFNPFLSGRPEYQFNAAYTIDTTAKTLVISVATLEGMRTIHGKYEVVHSTTASHDYLRLALGNTVPPTAAAPATSVLAPENSGGFVYFVGLRTEENMNFGPGEAAPLGTCKHVLKQGESVSSVAAQWQLQWQDLFAMNGHLVDPSDVQPGDVLTIGRSYRVWAGETLWSVATQFGTSWQRLIDTNPSLSSCANQALSSSPVCRIHPGDVLCIVPFLRNAICVAPNPARVFRVPTTG